VISAEEGNQIAASLYEEADKMSKQDVMDLQSEIVMEGEGPDTPPIFVLGFPRIGTTLIDQVLSTSPDVKTFEETREFYKVAQERKVIKTASYQQVTKSLYQSAIDRWKRYATEFRPHMDQIKPYAEKFGYEL